MLGFGGVPKFPEFEEKLTSQCFPLTGKAQHPYVNGIKGIMKAYQESFNYVDLSSPTYFEPIIRYSMLQAKKKKEAGSVDYTVLLLLTDGKCHDMQDTINAIIESADLPLSVIIIGIGAGDFSRMDLLDGDKGLKNHEGVEAARDLVQFVPFKNYESNYQLMAKRVLEEIP